MPLPCPEGRGISAIAFGLAACVGMLLLAGRVAGSDWPMWRYDAGRTLDSPASLPDQFGLQWSRKLPRQMPAWKDEPGMQFDRGYEPVAGGGLVFIGSTTAGSVTAFDIESGAEKWRFYSDGPVRFAPALWKSRVIFGSDDGVVYCLNAADGKLVWRFRAGPSDRWLVGNERIISTWPIRGGPAVANDTVYFAAGVWPFMGTFVYALDAASGKVVWFNDESSFSWRELPHPKAVGYSGLSAQGYVAVAGDRVIVPGSRSNAAMFDRKDGRLIGYVEGMGITATARGRFIYCGGQVASADKGVPVRLEGLGRIGAPVMGEDAWYFGDGIVELPAQLEWTTKLPAWMKPRKPASKPNNDDDDNGEEAAIKPSFVGTVKRRPVKLGQVWLKAGSRLVVNGTGGLQVIELGAQDEAKTVAQFALSGSQSSVIAAGGRLIVAMLDGTILCYGPGESTPRVHESPAPAEAKAPAWNEAAMRVLKESGVRDGYCLVVGIKDGGLVEELIRQSDLHVVAVDADAARVDALRRRLDAVGLHGTRGAAIVADPRSAEFVPYLASLITSEDLARAGAEDRKRLIERWSGILRPYGGVLCAVSASGAAEVLSRRDGALPGSADWCGQNADAGNTRVGRDQLVRAPLGVLWFGNAMSNSLVLPRHGEGPVEQVAGGRLIIEGPNSLSCSDVYTGRLLWTREFPGLGLPFDTTRHQRGAHALGSNFYAVADAVYVAVDKVCHVLDTATGKTLRELRLPGEGEAASQWFFLLVYEDLLIAGSRPIIEGSPVKRYNRTAYSRGVVAMDRRSGKVLWERDAREKISHFGIVAGAGKLFIADKPELVALDVRSGKVVWQTERCFSEGLSYSTDHDILLAGGALRGKDGEVLWEEVRRSAVPPATTSTAISSDAVTTSAGFLWWGKWGPMIRGDMIYTQGWRSVELLTGKQRTRVDGSGQLQNWGFRKAHGCGPTGGAWNMLVFRSGSAAFYDLERDGGTVNLGGFRSGCTSNLIAANGVLNAPDYTRTCSCGYSNRSSLALIHAPEVEYWAFAAPITRGRMGYNFGAPGDRVADDGTLWQETPATADERWGGPTLVVTEPPAPERFYLHSSRIVGGEGWKWVVGSGLVGLKSARVPLTGIDTSQELIVRLYFMEPTAAGERSRVFSVTLDGKEAISDMDIHKQAGGSLRGLVREIRGVRASSGEGGAWLHLGFVAKVGQPLICGVEVVQADRAGR